MASPRRISIKIRDTVVDCEVAQTPAAHALGLSKHASLSDGQGMLFDFGGDVRTRTFWMSEVRYPIDILGIDANCRVTRIVSEGQPGSLERWSLPKVAFVLEVPGGFSKKSGWKVGDVVKEYYHELYPDEMADAAVDDHEEKRLVSAELCPHCNNDAPKSEFFGGGDRRFHRPCTSKGPINKKPKAKKAQIIDEPVFVERMSNVIAGHVDEIQWKPDVLNGGATSRAVVTRRELTKWLSDTANPEAQQYIIAAASDEAGMSLIGDAFVLSGLADSARVATTTGGPALVLYRAAG